MKLVDLFHTIQGEGKYAGMLATFIRFPNCNLFCGLTKPLPDKINGEIYNLTQKEINKMKSKNATWVCDTMVQWRQSGKEYSVNEIVNIVKNTYNNSNYHIVFTGGEPLLHKKEILQLINEFEKLQYPPSKYEIESNATIPPLIHDKIIYNLSPKLKNSGLPENIRIKPQVLFQYQKLSKTHEVYLKFVVNTQNDVYDALSIAVDNEFLSEKFWSHIYFMPGAYTRKELITNSSKVVNFCKIFGINYSPRLQIFIWDKAISV